MIGRGVFVLTLLSNCAFSVPLTSSPLENEDVKVMKCIVEALADVLSRPHSVPLSQECLVTLKTDDRLVTILRHRNFLRELQEIAAQGDQERAQLQRDAGSPDPTTPTSEATDAADRSMLEALGGPGERSILSQKKRTGSVVEEKEKDQTMTDEESQEDNDSTEEVKRENDHPGSRVSEAAEEWGQSKAEKRQEEEEGEEESEEKRANSEEDNMTKDKNGVGSEEKIDQSKEKKSREDDEEETDKRSAFSSHKQKKEEREEELEVKGESKKSLKHWSKRGESVQPKKRARAKKAQEVSHHSKEVTDGEQADEEKNKRDSQRSPEEKELKMMAQRAPGERRASEEEGSGSRKSEEPEIESLAAIESELENVAQKLHELRRG